MKKLMLIAIFASACATPQAQVKETKEIKVKATCKPFISKVIKIMEENKIKNNFTNEKVTVNEFKIKYHYECITETSAKMMLELLLNCQYPGYENCLCMQGASEVFVEEIDGELKLDQGKMAILGANLCDCPKKKEEKPKEEKK